MIPKVVSYKGSLQLIADILSIKKPVDALKNQLETSQIDWDGFVIVASDYYVLTTCYSALKQKGLLDCLPDDLVLYLKEITRINRNRNKTLTEEIKIISELFNTHSIEHVFLKGAALLVLDIFEDYGARMIGDLDILVSETDLQKAHKLLTNNSYQATEQGTSAKFFEHKHLPRLQSDQKLAAVEIHKQLFVKSMESKLKPERILATKRLVNNIYIPSNEVLLLHTILNFQINDLGYVYNRISMKSIYDYLLIRKTNNINTPDHKYYQHFFSIGKLFYSDFNTFRSLGFKNYIFLLRLKYHSLRTFLDGLIKQFRFLKAIFTTRIWEFFKNSSYRRAIAMEYRKKLGF